MREQPINASYPISLIIWMKEQVKLQQIDIFKQVYLLKVFLFINHQTVSMEGQVTKQSVSAYDNHLAVSYQNQTLIYHLSTFSLLWSLPFEHQAISFLHQTGLFVIASSTKPSVASIHDYKYKRHIKDIDFVSPILNVHYSRNLLLVFSQQKIQGYDLSTDQNILYLKVRDGQKSFHSCFYETLRIGYSIENSFISHSLWDSHKFQLEDLDYSEGRYTDNGEYFVLKVKNDLNVYTNNSLINIIHLPQVPTIYLLNPIKGRTPTFTLITSNQNEPQIKLESFFRLQQTSAQCILRDTQNWDTKIELEGIIAGKLYILRKSKVNVYQILQ